MPAQGIRTLELLSDNLGRDAIEGKKLLALLPHHAQGVVDEGRRDLQLRCDDLRGHALHVVMEHAPLLLILLELALVEAALGQVDSCSEPLSGGCALWLRRV